MNAKEALRSTMDMSLFVLQKYLDDLSDADLLKRPPGCNHLAWQLGHLISSEVQLLDGICPGKGAALPAGFAERHSKETTAVDDPSRFDGKQRYLDLFAQVRAATMKALEELAEKDLDAPGPERFRQLFPTVGAMFTLIGTHPMMHAGQFAVVRRMLGKPIVI